MTELHWGLWDESIVLGVPEYKAVALAHGIILTVAVVRYALKPQIARLREHWQKRVSSEDGAETSVPS